MKSGLFSLALLCLIPLFSGCEKKEVELLPIDMLTGGSSKDWKTLSFSIDSDFLIPADIMMDSVVTFERKFGSNGAYLGTYYTWHHLFDDNQDFVSEIKKFEGGELWFYEVFKDGEVSEEPQIWKVTIIDREEIKLTLHSENLEEWIKNPVTDEFEPNPDFGKVTTRELHLLGLPKPIENL